MKNKVLLSALFLFPVITFAASHMASDRISDIRNTKHNFAANDLVELPGGATAEDGRKVKAVSNDEVCVYCHTPHGDPQKAAQDRPFLWNRNLDNKVYADMYDSSSLNASSQNLGTGSRMCLSCHDGTVAIGQVEVLNGRLSRMVSGFGGSDSGLPVMEPSSAIAMTGENLDADGSLKEDSDGYTANLGEDLSNDHPLGFIYNTQLATDDGELQDPSDSSLIGVRVGGGVAQHNEALVNAGGNAGSAPTSSMTRVALPLESSVPRIASGETNFVSVASEGTVECTTCHDPHIRGTDTAENIKFLRLHRFQKTQPPLLSTGDAEPDFNIDADINCVACHKKKSWSPSVHAQAANTYKDEATTLREFPSTTTVWEASCLNCHDPHTENGSSWLLRAGADDSENSAIEQTCFECHGSNPVVNADTGKAIADIQTLNALSGHQAFDFITDSDTQQHNSQSSDLDETQQNLKDNRHVTCTDCHNPHRTLLNTEHDANGEAGSGLHAHKDGVVHSNKLSGALNGVSGVRTDSSAVVTFDPYDVNSGIIFTELKGVIDATASNAADVVTKEYQICLKCHSDYSDTLIGTVDAVSGLRKANTAMEFSEAAVSYHPVVVSTNSNTQPAKADITKTDANNFESPFEQAVGSQTMYCSDCHSNDVATGPQGPHGSAVDKILVADGDNLCIACHKADQYQNATGAVLNSGFSCTAGNCAAAEAALQNNNLHIFHAVQAGGSNVCTDCHVAVPHGWKNKALLANVNDADNADTRYYRNAKSKIDTMQNSGEWTRASCGGNAGCHLP